MSNIISKININSDIENNLEYIINNKIYDIHKIVQSKGYKIDPVSLKDNILSVTNQLFIEYLLSSVNKFVDKILESNIWAVLGVGPIVKSSYIEYFNLFYKEMLLNKEFRLLFYDVYSVINSDIIDRYTKNLYHRKGYGHLYMFAKPISNPQLLTDLLKLSSLIYPVVLTPFRIDNKVYIIDEYLVRKDLIDEFLSILVKYINSRLGKIPNEVVEIALHASINKRKLIFDIGLNVRADLLRALITVAKFKSKQVDINNKMADTPEKSLITIFKQQVDFLGLEKNLIYELEMVTRENRW
ncbi:MAG TPA: hypothetical protein PKW55_01325 [Spirochaetota bacterium]|nr:hypothetical protein [Spirochaetota bacterium]HOM38868.1 hypothetical protein [Spirochaetota bacterium]